MFEIKNYTGADGFPMRYGELRHADHDPNGPAMLYIPGLGGSVKGALDFLEQLLPSFGPIYGPDLRSFGLNPVEAPPYSANHLLPDMEAFYQQVILPANHRELVLVGISLGGILATLLACRHPERFSKLILLAPAFRPHPKSFSLSYTVLNTLSFMLRGKHSRTTLPYGIEALTTNPAILNDPQYAEHPPIELNAGFLLGVRTLCNQAFSEIRKLSLPTLVVIPGMDIVCDPTAMRAAYERIPATTPKLCKEYPDFYHDVLFEAGHSDIAKALLEWSNHCASLATSCSSI